MSILIFIIAFLLLVIGIIGSIIPAIPGPLTSYFGVLILYFFAEIEFSFLFLFTTGILVFMVFFLDYFFQVIGVKKFGGGDISTFGTFVGIFFGLFFSPIGFLLGPFIGAFIGAKLEKKKSSKALKIAIGSFFGFFTGTILKLGLSLFLFFNSAYQIFF